MRRSTSPVIVVSVHDVAPATAAAAQRYVELFRPLPIRLTLLVVPGPWRGHNFAQSTQANRDLAEWLRGQQELGDEISVHGWCHRADVPGSPPRRLVGQVVARGAAELWALDREQAAQRTHDGIAVLRRHGLDVLGTTPPGWLAGRAAAAGLADAGLRYTTDHTGLQDLRTGRRWHAPALCHRPASPDAGVALAEWAGAQVLANAWRLIHAGRCARIAVHPADLDRPGLAEAAVRAVRRCLDTGATPHTYAQVFDGLATRRPRTGAPR